MSYCTLQLILLAQIFNSGLLDLKTSANVAIFPTEALRSRSPLNVLYRKKNVRPDRDLLSPHTNSKDHRECVFIVCLVAFDVLTQITHLAIFASCQLSLFVAKTIPWLSSGLFLNVTDKFRIINLGKHLYDYCGHINSDAEQRSLRDSGLTYSRLLPSYYPAGCDQIRKCDSAKSRGPNINSRKQVVLK